MTVNYDADDHLGVIFRIHGSVLPSVLPWCFFNAAIACLIWFLRSYDIVNATFDGGLGYQYISVLVSFFVVSNVNTAYNRFWEARGFLGHAIFAVTKLVLRVAVYSGKEKHEKAVMWRKVIGVRLSRILRFAMYTIQKDRITVLNKKVGKMEGGDLHEEVQLMSREALNEELDYDVDISQLAFAVEAAVRSHADFLDGPLHINEQMDLLGKVNSFLDAYDGLIKNALTPRPFPTVQMGRTLLIAWVLSLPFALAGKIEDDLVGLFALLFIVFLVTYGFMGLTAAEIELHDPYGDDANDLEVKKYTGLALENIGLYLYEGADFSRGFNFQADMDFKTPNAPPSKVYDTLV